MSERAKSVMKEGFSLFCCSLGLTFQFLSLLVALDVILCSSIRNFDRLRGCEV